MTSPAAAVQNGRPPPSSLPSLDKLPVIGRKDQVTRYLIDAGKLIRQVEGLLDQFALDDFDDSIAQVIRMGEKLKKRPGPQWIYVTGNRRYIEAAQELVVTAQTLSAAALQRAMADLRHSPTPSGQSSTSSNSTPTSSIVNNNVYQISVGNNFDVKPNNSSDTAVLSPTPNAGSGPFTGRLIYPTDEAGKRVFDDVVASVDKRAVEFGPDGLPSLLNLQTTPVAPESGHPDATPGGVRRTGSKISLKSLNSIYSETCDVSADSDPASGEFDRSQVAAMLVVDDEQLEKHDWIDRAAIFGRNIGLRS